MEPHYKADGWLGPLVLTKLYFNFAKETHFDASMAKLVKEIGHRGKGSEKCECDGKIMCLLRKIMRVKTIFVKCATTTLASNSVILVLMVQFKLSSAMSITCNHIFDFTVTS